MPSDHPLYAGVRVSVASIAWTVAASGAGIALGITAGSLVLVAFGAVGVFDAIGSAVLVSHFRHAIRHDAISRSRERIAQRVVAFGLLVVGSATLAAAAVRLAARDRGHEPVAGLVVAAASALVLYALAFQKRRLGRRIPSRALVADGGLSLVGALTGLATLTGAGLNTGMGWWWADPIAACAIALAALGLSAVTLRRDDGR